MALSPSPVAPGWQLLSEQEEKALPSPCLPGGGRDPASLTPIPLASWHFQGSSGPWTCLATEQGRPGRGCSSGLSPDVAQHLSWPRREGLDPEESSWPPGVSTICCFLSVAWLGHQPQQLFSVPVGCLSCAKPPGPWRPPRPGAKRDMRVGPKDSASGAGLSRGQAAGVRGAVPPQTATARESTRPWEGKGLFHDVPLALCVPPGVHVVCATQGDATCTCLPPPRAQRQGLISVARGPTLRTCTRSGSMRRPGFVPAEGQLHTQAWPAGYTGKAFCRECS